MMHIQMFQSASTTHTHINNYNKITHVSMIDFPESRFKTLWKAQILPNAELVLLEFLNVLFQCSSPH